MDKPRPTPATSDGALYQLELVTDAPELVSSLLISSGFLKGTELIEEEGEQLVVSYLRPSHPPSPEQVEHEISEILAPLEDVDWTLRAFEAQEKESWQASWRDSFEPTSLSTRITVQPPWTALPPPEEGTLLTINPGMAFGTGHHATTRLAAELLDDRLDALEPPPSLLDVGCGSGVLSMAAARLGAGPILGLDIEREIIQVARQNLENNELDDDVELSMTPVQDLDGTWDVVVANIRSRILRELRDALLARVAEGGYLIVSGIMADQREAFLEAFAPETDAWTQTRDLEDDAWLGFEWRRTSS